MVLVADPGTLDPVRDHRDHRCSADPVRVLMVHDGHRQRPPDGERSDTVLALVLVRSFCRKLLKCHR